jgi:exocyst complex component 2
VVDVQHSVCLLYGVMVNLQVGILKRVLEEVEKVMQEFRGMLYKSMEDPHLDLAEVSGTCL